jgi:hypothetical protein
MDPKYLRDDLASKLAHAAEEVSELTKELADLGAALAKTMRWGPLSYNPELHEPHQETNAEWIRRAMANVGRELRDHDATMGRLMEHLILSGYLEEDDT